MFIPGVPPYRPPMILPMRRPPSPPRVVYVSSRSRSPSVISISSSTGPLEGRHIRRRIRANTRSNWYGVLASFVLIACLLIVLIFESKWSSRMQGHPKQFPPQRLIGPFGRPETAAPLDHLTNDVGEIIARARVKVEPPPTTTSTERTERYTGEYFAPAVNAEEGTSAECNTLACLSLRRWFVETVVSQANPCRKRNRFICDASLSLPTFQRWIEEVSIDAGKLASIEGVEPGTGPSATRPRSKMRTESREKLLQSCLRYALLPQDGVDDVLLFLSHFNLELLNMTEDSAEHPLTRMMQLSLDYGVDVPVSFSRKYNVSGEGAQAFVFQISLNQELNEFFHGLLGLGEAEVMDFYKHTLSQYALLDDTSIAEELVNADDELADIANRPAHPNGTRSLDVASLSEHTGVEAGRWRQLLNTYHIRSSEMKQLGKVAADERALALVEYMSRPGDRLAMRRLLAWHVLVYLLGPKAELLLKLSGTQGHPSAIEDDVPTAFLKQKCERMMAKLHGVRYGVLDLFVGNNAVPTETVAKVSRFMAHFQSATAFAFKGSEQGVKFVSPTALTRLTSAGARTEDIPLFPIGTSRAPGELFAAVGGVEKGAGDLEEKEATASGSSFLLLWLRHLRAWHALPPLMQVLLPVMTSLDKGQPADFFRLPYYDEDALPAYNFAGLGQVVARALLRHAEELRQKDSAMSERWQRFWSAAGAFTHGATYCLVDSRKQNDTSRLETTDATTAPNWLRADHNLALKLSYLAFLRSRGTNTGPTTKPGERLPGIRLSKEQLFLVMHCALSCSAGGGPGDTSRQVAARQKCVVDYATTSKRFAEGPCTNAPRVNSLDECSYL